MITVSQVLRLHELSIIDFGGGFGVRDKELLESAVERIKATFDGESLYPSSFQKAAAILESIIKNHPFVDGNKRTAWLACCSILRYDNYRFNLSQIAAYDFVIKVASSHLEFEEIVSFIEANTKHILQQIMSKKIAIIGGGNLGSAIAEGLINSGFINPNQLLITKRNITTLDSLKEKGVLVSDNNLEAAAFADYIILAVKPFQIKDVLSLMLPSLDAKKHVLVSVVTGVWVKDIEEVIGTSFPIFRAMPNTAIAIQESMTCISDSNASKEQKEFVGNVFDKLGKTVFIEEKLMDAATVLAASGTAFAMRYIRANIQAGIEIGFSAANASLIAAQTVKGAADLLQKKGSHPEQEIDKVTTPKGCTIAGLNEMEHQGFSSSLIKGIVTSYKKILSGM